MTSPIDALRALREEMWDPERGMDRYAPGVVPGVDISALNLHAVRETALGAFLDLRDGNRDRAITALRNVLGLQHETSRWPWSGTFPVSAEQPDPPGADAVEWVHYDPNWRQFIGCTLAMCRLAHRGALPDDLLTGIETALSRCVAGEPDDRIAPWYTNPNLMHAWLQAHVGAETRDSAMLAKGHERLAELVGRFERFGDIDEYNSPTYDGIDLWSIGLWATHPPTPRFADAAALMLPRIGARISTLYHPTFGATCGPYIRAYGLDPTSYLSLSGLLFSVAGQPVDRVLPSPLDADTVHVHDLYFIPVLEHVGASLVTHLDLEPVVAERRHLQRFDASTAEHVLRPDLQIGWEHGRRHEDALDQYVPFCAHFVGEHTTSSIGLMLPDETVAVDCLRVDGGGPDDPRFRVTAIGRAGAVAVRVVTSSPVTPMSEDTTAEDITTEDTTTAGRVGTTSAPITAGLRLDRCELTFDAAPDEVVETTTPSGHQMIVRWRAPIASMQIALRASRASTS